MTIPQTLFKTRSMLLAFAALPVMAVAFSSFAYAQKSTTISPQTAWAITPVKESVKSQPYCALARRFDQGIVLTLAQNIRGDLSLAIDFQRNQLDTGRYYSALVDAGQSVGQSFEVQPVSPSAIVLRMGRALAFLDALTESGGLNVTLDGHLYRFNLSDAAQGLTELKTCLEELNPKPKAKSPAPLAASKPVDDMGLTPLPKVSPLPKVEKQDIAEADALPSDTAPLSLKAETISPRLDDDRAPGQKSGRDTTDYSKIVQKLRLENQKLAGLLEQTRAETKAAPQMDSGQSAEIVRLKAEAETLTRQLDALSTQNASLQAKIDARSDLNALPKINPRPEIVTKTVADPETQRENVALKEDLAQAQQKIAGLQNQISLAARAQTGGGDTYTALKAETETLLAQLKSLSAENQALKAQAESLARAEPEVVTKTVQDPALLEEKQQLQSQLDAAIQQIASLKTQLSATAKAQSSVKQAYEGLESESTARLQALEAENEALKSQINATQSSETAELSALRQENARLKTALAKEKEKAAESMVSDQAQGELNAINADLSQRVLMLESDNQALKSRLTLESADREVDQRKVSELESALETANTEIARLAKALSVAEQQSNSLNAVNAQTDARIQTLISENFDLTNEIAALKKDAKSIVEMGRRITALEAENTRLSQALEQTKASFNKTLFDAVSERDLKISQLRQEKLDLADQLKSAQYRITQLQSPERLQKYESAEIAVLEETIQNLQADNNQIAKQLNALKSGAGAYRSAYAGSGPRVPAVPAVDVDIEPLKQASRAAETQTNKVKKPAQAKEQPKAKKPLGFELTPPSKGASASEEKRLAVLALPEFKDGSQVASFLDQAGFETVGLVEPVAAPPGPDIKAYQWRDKTLFATLEQRASMGLENFDELARLYLTRLEGRCTGDFAVRPDIDRGQSEWMLSTYDIACTTEDSGAGAGILFYAVDGLFTAIAYEAALPDIEEAIISTEKMAGYLQSSES